MFCVRSWRKRMIEEISRLVRAVVPKVFETMFFVFFEEVEDGAGPAGVGAVPAPSAWVQSEIAFQGSEYSGKIRLFLPYEMSRRLAGDFIGTADEPITEMQTRDMVGEVTNMIAGNLFSHLDKKERYAISVPLTEVVSCPDSASEERRKTFFFNCEEEPIRVDIEFEAGKGDRTCPAHP